jgi:5'-3' exonuclease
MRLLVDADIPIYQLASKHQEILDFEDGSEPYISTNIEGAKAGFVSYLGAIFDELKSDDMIMLLSDKENWRKDINPEYKANRKDVVRPKLLPELRKFVEDNYECMCKPKLEADDLCSILATRDPQNTIVVSNDKDMFTIPKANFYRPMYRERGVHKNTVASAWYEHMVQTLKGDSTDGYYGIFGMGDKGARKLLDNVTNGEEGVHYATVWKAVEHAYYTAKVEKHMREMFIKSIEDKELTPYHFRKQFKIFKESFELPNDMIKYYKQQAKDDALMNARMAHLLTDAEWNDNIDMVKTYWEAPE